MTTRVKKLIITFTVGLLTQGVLQAQGTVTYLSNLGQTPTGNDPVGSDSWLATDIFAGNNIGGYVLNSVQLGMTDASGNPSGFTLMIYSATFGVGISPGSSLATLNGSANPSTTGIYTYTSDSRLTLSPGTDYFIVLTAGTTVANGSYEWNLTIPNVLIGNGSWKAGGIFHSADGSNWNYNSGALQFSITATPVPEPSTEVLLGLGGILLLGLERWKARAA